MFLEKSNSIASPRQKQSGLFAAVNLLGNAGDLMLNHLVLYLELAQIGIEEERQRITRTVIAFIVFGGALFSLLPITVLLLTGVFLGKNALVAAAGLLAAVLVALAVAAEIYRRRVSSTAGYGLDALRDEIAQDLNILQAAEQTYAH